MTRQAPSQPQNAPVISSYANGADGIVQPDYSGAWIGGLFPALLRGRVPAGLPDWIARVAPVVVVLIDGLGWQMYQRFAALLPALGEFEGGPITTVVPSTTATALPSLTTGRTPGEHGMFGDRMRVGGRMLSVLQWTVPDGEPPAPATVQRHAPFGGRVVPVISLAKFAGTGFSQAHLRGASFLGYETTDELVARVGESLGAGARLVFAYLPHVDRSAHERGMEHGEFEQAVTTAGHAVRRIRHSVPASGAVIVTADHGHVAVDPGARIDMTPLQPLVSAMSGSSRLRYLHARPGAAPELLVAARQLVGDHAWIHDRGSLVASGWLGPSTAALTTGRLGDVILAARGEATLIDRSEERLNRLLTMHGSVTAAEMLVPLLVARGLAAVPLRTLSRHHAP